MPAIKVRDDLRRELVFLHPPERLVSLVPSDTHSLVALGAADRIVGKTRYCPEVAGGRPDIAIVGGTKDVDVDAVLALAPHLVIGNQEENTRPALEALAARVPVLVSLPRRVGDGFAHLARLARILGAGIKSGGAVRELIERTYHVPIAPPPRARAFVPIWMGPLMTLNADTFGSDVLACAGVENAFGDRLRLYPLAADLGKGEAQDAPGRDQRYPRVTLDEVVKRGADLVVLPDEPYAFSAADEQVFRDALPHAKIVRVDGKDLFWYGAWTLDALPRLSRLF